MNRLKRFLFQLVLWLVIWLTAWFFLGANFRFLIDNSPSFIFQILVIAVLIYYAAPSLLFKKKYTLFVVISLVLIVVIAFLISNPFHVPPPRIASGPGMPKKPPPKFLIQLSLLSIAYILATFVETFLFAQKKEEESIRNKSENLRTELKLLKSQINPHFLFNSLNNIYALSVIDSKKTQQSISRLSDMLRYVLYDCERPFVPIHKEVTYIEDYLEMFSLKSSKTFPIETDFKIMDANVRIAPMLLIPFVENALKHGSLEKIEGVFLRIKISSDTREVKFEIENSIPEISVHKDAVGGIGIENVKKRLQILYPQSHELLIQEESTTFKVSLKLELNEKD